MSDSWTHYDNLKVSPRADAEVIKAAYRALAQKWHPDKHPPERKARCERVMHLINDAYRVLSDPASRARYDESLTAARAGDGGARSAGPQAAGTTPAGTAGRAPSGEPARRGDRHAAGSGEPPSEPATGEDDVAGLSHYDLLELAWDASVEQVDVARAVALAKWHPCRHPAAQQRTCERMHAAIGRAAACLSDPAARRAYNGELMRRHPQAWTRAHERRRAWRVEGPDDAAGARAAQEARRQSPDAADPPPAQRPGWIARSGDLIAALVDTVRASLHGAGSAAPHAPASPRAAGRDPGATAT
jgi:DnaJ-class molecular chaperone